MIQNNNHQRRKTISNHNNINHNNIFKNNNNHTNDLFHNNTIRQHQNLNSYQNIHNKQHPNTYIHNHNQIHTLHNIINTQINNTHNHIHHNPYYLDPLQKHKKNKQTQYYTILDQCTQIPAENKLLLRNYIKNQNQQIFSLFQKYKQSNTKNNHQNHQRSSQSKTKRENSNQSHCNKQKITFHQLQICLRKFLNKQKSKNNADHDQNWRYYQESLRKKSTNSKQKQKKSIFKPSSKQLNQRSSRSHSKQAKQKINNINNQNKIKFNNNKEKKKNQISCQNLLASKQNRRFSQQVQLQKPSVKTFRHNTIENQQEKYLKSKKSGRNKVQIRKISMTMSNTARDKINSDYNSITKEDNKQKQRIGNSETNSPIKNPKYQLTTNQNHTQTESNCLGSSYLNQNLFQSQASNTINSFNPGSTHPYINLKNLNQNLKQDQSQERQIERGSSSKKQNQNVKQALKQRGNSNRKLICIKIGTPDQLSKSKDIVNKQSKTFVDQFYLEKKIQRQIDFQIQKQLDKDFNNQIQSSLVFKDISIMNDANQQSALFQFQKYDNLISFSSKKDNNQQELSSSIQNANKINYFNFNKKEFQDIPNINVVITPSMKNKKSIENIFNHQISVSGFQKLNNNKVFHHQDHNQQIQNNVRSNYYFKHGKSNSHSHSDNSYSQSKSHKKDRKIVQSQIQQFYNDQQGKNKEDNTNSTANNNITNRTHRTFIQKRSNNSQQDLTMNMQIDMTAISKHQQGSQTQSRVSSYFPFGFNHNKNNMINANNVVNTILNAFRQQSSRNHYQKNEFKQKQDGYIWQNDKKIYKNEAIRGDLKPKERLTQQLNIKHKNKSQIFTINHQQDYYGQNQQNIQGLPLGNNFNCSCQYYNKIDNFNNKDGSSSLIFKNYPQNSQQNKKKSKKSITNNRYYRNLQGQNSLKSLQSYQYFQYKNKNKENDENISKQDYQMINDKKNGDENNNKYQESQLLPQKIKIVQFQQYPQSQIKRRLFSSIHTQFYDLSNKKNNKNLNSNKYENQNERQLQYQQQTIQIKQNKNNNINNNINMVKSKCILKNSNLDNIQSMTYYNDVFQNNKDKINNHYNHKNNIKDYYECSITQQYQYNNYVPKQHSFNLNSIQMQRSRNINNISNKLNTKYSQSSLTLKRNLLSQSLQKITYHNTNNSRITSSNTNHTQIHKNKKYQPGDFYKRIKMAIQS